MNSCPVVFLLFVVFSVFCSGFSFARDRIRMIGSSTVLPYAQIAAELFSQTFPDFKTPIIESGGSGAGIKEFCKGVGANTVDIVNSSRAFLESELKACQVAGVTELQEIKFGYDGIVFAVTLGTFDFSLSVDDIYRALAARVVYGDKLIKNPYHSWKDINPALPDVKITLYIPGAKHGTRSSLEDLIMLRGCKSSGNLEFVQEHQGMSQAAAEAFCKIIRNDGKAIDIDGDNTEIFSRLTSGRAAVGVLSLSFYENNADLLQALKINAVLPSVATIVSGEYLLSRPLFFYVKKQNLDLIPGLCEYVGFFLDDRIAGFEGALAEYGLAPISEVERKAQLEAFQVCVPLS